MMGGLTEDSSRQLSSAILKLFLFFQAEMNKHKMSLTKGKSPLSSRKNGDRSSKDHIFKIPLLMD